MNKYIILLIVALFSTGTVMAESKFKVYGKANVSMQSLKEEVTKDVYNVSTKGVHTDNWQMLSNASRLGFKGSVDLEHGLKAIYKMEYETSFDDGDKSGQTFTQRNIFVGVEGAWGSVIAGKHDTPVKMIGKPVDIFSDYKYADIKNIGEGENRNDNMVMYRSPTIADVIKINVMFSPGEDSGSDADSADTDLSNDNNGFADEISASISYQSDFGLSLALGIDDGVDDQELFRFVTAYKMNDFGVSLMLQEAEETNLQNSTEKPIEVETIFLTGFYKLTDWKFKVLLGNSEATYIDTIGDNLQITLGADYKLGKKTKLFAYYSKIDQEIEVSSVSALETKTQTFGIGLEHKFSSDG